MTVGLLDVGLVSRGLMVDLLWTWLLAFGLRCCCYSDLLLWGLVVMGLMVGLVLGCLTVQVVLCWFVTWLLCCVVCLAGFAAGYGYLVFCVGVNSVGHAITHYGLLV